MFNLTNHINSGILELYVLGLATDAEIAEVNELAKLHNEVENEINRITKTLIRTASNSIAIKPSDTLKPLLFAFIDYGERLKNGEPVSYPPMLNAQSKIIDFNAWLERADMTIPNDFEFFHAKIIGYTPKATTAIIWLSLGAPPEVHDCEQEHFLIIEGMCDITIEDETTHLKAGDYFEIDLYKSHHLIVTSKVPCKAILQRVAA